ncbi:MAG: T9SS type A sorting domain-containing protein [Flavobacteriales bacterium]|nr:T9SS type A sorting domain-containing protein [Flavobacteriales bacterium]
MEFGSTGHEDLFPNANMAYTVNSDDIFQYISLTDNAYATAGFYGPWPSFNIYLDPHDFIIFPAEIGASFSDSYISSGASEPSPNMFGESQMEIDGYGDILMPWGTVEGAYRVSGTTEYINVFVSQGDTVETFFAGILTNFFAPGFPIPVVSVTEGILTIPESQEISDVETMQFISNFTVSTDELVVNDLQVFPNPASDQLTIDFEKRDAQPLQVDLLSVQGRVVQSAGQIGAGFVHYQSQMDVSKLPAGFYLFRLAAGDATQMVKVVVK